MKARLLTSAQALVRSLGKTPSLGLYLALVVMALFSSYSALRAEGNRQAAESWSAESRTWQERNGELQELLSRSEVEVQRLEERQLSLAGEKIAVEDRKEATTYLLVQATIAGELQSRCLQATKELIAKIRADERDWVSRNSGEIFAGCRLAEESWAKITEEGKKR
jgi:hypothetical protein